jgi:hypothetical protein
VSCRESPYLSLNSFKFVDIGSHVGVPYTMSTYSFVDGTREIYAIFLHSCRQYQRFLFMKHDAECFFHYVEYVGGPFEIL